MHEPNHQEYYLARAKAARELARNALNPKIAAIHLEMADSYDAKARDLQANVVPIRSSVQAA